MADLLPVPDQQQPPAPFVWGAGGAMMTPERIAAERKVAQAMMQNGMDYSPIRSPFQGAARVAQALMGAYDDRRAGQAENANAAADKAMVSSWFSGGTPVAPAAGPAPGAGAAPSPSMPAPAPTVLGAGGQPSVADAQGVYPADATMMPQDTAVAAAPTSGPVPRGIRNNNPLNIEAGGFTQGQPGYTGSDGRFAQFQTPDQGVAAASKLLDTYQSKYGLNTVRGIVNRWAPSAEAANNTSGYVASVAGRLGIDPDKPLQPGQRQALIQAMGQFENGRPIGGASAAPVVAAAEDPAALPPNATPTQGAMPPGVPAPTGAVTPTAAPGVSSVAGAMQGVNPGVVAAMQSPYTSDATKKIAALILQHQMGDKVGYQTQPDGTILQTDPTGRQAPKVVYQAPVKAELKDMGTDPITGQKTYQPYHPVTGQPLAPPPGSAPAPQSGMLAQGVTAVDHSLKGDDYLNQYGPEVQAAVKAYIAGDVMPSGNPRMNALASTAKTIAQKYGADMNIPVSDELYSAKRKMMTDLASSSANSSGGIISNGKSAFEHLTNLSDKFVDLGNANGPDVPGGSHVASVGNLIGNVVAPSSTTRGKVSAVNDNALKYGQESTKFYAGSGGGEGERMFALKNLNPERTSGNEQASFLQTEKELMLGRLRQKEAQIRDTLGQSYLDKHPVMTPDLSATLSKLDDNILKLRGQGAPTAAAPATAAPSPSGQNKTSSGVTWSVQ